MIFPSASFLFTAKTRLNPDPYNPGHLEGTNEYYWDDETVNGEPLVWPYHDEQFQLQWLNFIIHMERHLPTGYYYLVIDPVAETATGSVVPLHYGCVAGPAVAVDFRYTDDECSEYPSWWVPGSGFLLPDDQDRLEMAWGEDRDRYHDDHQPLEDIHAPQPF